MSHPTLHYFGYQKYINLIEIRHKSQIGINKNFDIKKKVFKMVFDKVSPVCNYVFALVTNLKKAFGLP